MPLASLPTPAFLTLINTSLYLSTPVVFGSVPGMIVCPQVRKARIYLVELSTTDISTHDSPTSRITQEEFVWQAIVSSRPTNGQPGVSLWVLRAHVVRTTGSEAHYLE